MIEIKKKSDYDLTKNWYRKKEFLDELWKGMKLPTLDHYIRQMRNSPYSFGICGTHGNVFIHAEVFKDWFDYKIFHENEAVIA